MRYVVKVTQLYRATRTVEIEVSADNAYSALEDVESGNRELPRFNDPAWNTGWELLDETVELKK